MTIKQTAIQKLEELGGWQYSGRISRLVADLHQCKESNAERRLMELEDEGLIESQLVDNPNGRGNRVVQYRVKHTQELPPAYKDALDTHQIKLL